MGAERIRQVKPPIWVEDFTLETSDGFIIAYAYSEGAIIPLHGDEALLRRFVEAGARLLARRAKVALCNVVRFPRLLAKH